jgi:Ni,Fe-hydrogenase III large subunit
LAASPFILIGLWADTAQVHALLLDEAALSVIPVSTPIADGQYPGLSPNRPHARTFERMIADLWGHTASGAAEHRPLFDHGAWPVSKPMAPRPEAARRPYEDGETPQVDSDPIMHLPAGPIWGRIEEAAGLRLTVRGNTIASAEGQLGYTHKGTLALIRGKSPRTAARFAARLSGDSTVAHSIAFATAAENALAVTAPPRAAILRGAILEIERIAGHLDNLAEVGRLAGAPSMHARCGALREYLLRSADSAFGHRLMMDCVVPGGIALDIAEGGPQVILRALGKIASDLPMLRADHDSAILSARLNGVGRVSPVLAIRFGAGGVVGRAAGRRFDARMMTSGYVSPNRRPAARSRTDAIGRQHQRLDEIGESLKLVSTALESLPSGPLTVALPQESGEGIGCAESSRGDIWHWLRLDHGQIAACFPRDPGWGLWPLAEQVLENAAAEDADLIRTSFALPASGMDL